MARHKNRPVGEDLKIRKRRAQVAELRLQGKPQWVIAQILKVSQVQIHRDLKHLDEEWAKESVVKIDEIKRRELEKLDLLEKTYWEGWTRSLRDRGRDEVTTISDKVDAAATATESDAERKAAEEKKAGKVTTTKKKVKEKSDGDARFLEGVRQCVKQRCEMLGIATPDMRELEKKIDQLTDTVVKMDPNAP